MEGLGHGLLPRLTLPSVTPPQVLKLTQQYCSERSIPFPPITLSKEDWKNSKECYIFTDAKNPKTPIVLHFPLINQSFRKFKAPGTVRVLESN